MPFPRHSPCMYIHVQPWPCLQTKLISSSACLTSPRRRPVQAIRALAVFRLDHSRLSGSKPRIGRQPPRRRYDLTQKNPTPAITKFSSVGRDLGRNPRVRGIRVGLVWRMIRSRSGNSTRYKALSLQRNRIQGRDARHGSVARQGQYFNANAPR